ncbi:amino acid transporter [Renibacterium salmoninarum ATCC 33209]|uniref:Amino acid transporter n=1 Tax=Renibacterium salmoninarum (strain ATCC 33209 / DSM 20767 / JCM 11484 / NBRC 15589 / NCIMB 2235) TaxID=288705 RepID=A9WNN1_RENSM|nr:amino acid permease [Renibacterium salmoninarum]ABY23249.1 amino acid transporter [Renibacterium salmoninarum ATCC 33209]
MANTKTAKTSTALESSQKSLTRGLKPRQLIMMALGSSIGTGLFIGSSSAIGVAGPAVLISFLIAGAILIFVMRMLGEMAAAHPNSGAFSYYAERAMGKVAGATVGWLWWVQIVVVVAAEATGAAQILSELWPVLPQWLLALVFMVLFTGINLLGVGRFGQLEFWFAILKVAVIVIFLVVGVLLIVGIIPSSSGAGFRNLFDHGGFLPTGWAGVAAGLLIVVFAFGGTELVTIAAAETEDAERNVGRAIRSVLWRILVFYIGSVLVMVAVLPWDSAETKNPFASVLAEAHIPYAKELTTLVIAIAVLSALNANLYGSSRMIFSLSERGMAPKFISKLGTDRVPRIAVLASVLFGFMAVVLNYIDQEHALKILLQFVGSTVLMMWLSTVASQLILRRRANAAGEKMSLPMWGFPYLSWLTLALIAAVFVLGFTDAQVAIQLLSTIGLTAGIAILSWIGLKLSDKTKK